MSGRRLTAGVLGGMGPAATIDFMARVLRAAEARSDQDHVRMIVDQNPLAPDRNAAAAGRGPSPGPVLAEMARGLERAGADFLVMACNTAHGWEAEVRAATRLPFVSIVAETMAEVGEARRVGLLAADGCLNAGLYQRAFAGRGVQALVPQPATQARFMDLIYAIKRGDTGPEARAAMRGIADELVAAGAETLVAACTEVPLVLEEAAAPLVNTTDVLARRTVAYALGREPLPE